ncbi:glutamate-cysteine ligase family protein [Herbidospora mongoliensis]|uniref:glutamate-cysteine ligase family protein n=1 Tax=Herbidospora mongoliensis TaxID=688067 RepID=UPI00147176BF|nr:glutamate-cysteine ligase family protein [Herbidospora mongoliensis]
MTLSELSELFSVEANREELIGVEVEHGLVDPRSGVSVPYHGPRGAQALLTALHAHFGGTFGLDGEHVVSLTLPDGAAFSLETGCALEYASAPNSDLRSMIMITRTHLEEAAAVAAGLDIALLSGASIPFTPVSRIPWLPKPRVQLMRDYFAGLGDAGAYGDAVMGVTLSTQTSLDYLSEADMLAKLRMLVGAAPLASALFVASPLEEGRESGWLSRRMAYWRKFDPRRCGVLDFALKDSASIADIVEWAVALPMIYRDSEGRHVAAPPMSFKQAMTSGFGDQTWPSFEDWSLHLGQVWPHVRARRTLEIRSLDGLPWPFFGAGPALWVGLTYDAESIARTTDLLSGFTTAELDQAALDVAFRGLDAHVSGVPITEVLTELLRYARAGLTHSSMQGLLDPIEEVLDSGVTFAHHILMNWRGSFHNRPDRYVSTYRVPV